MGTEEYALILSVISIGISFVTLWQDRKMNSINLQADYYKKVFEEYLMVRIPEAVRMLSFDEEGKLCESYKKTNEILIEMLDKCAYFAYANNSFYEELRKIVTDIDEKLVVCATEKIIDRDAQYKFIYELHVDIQNMVKKINKAYMS